jgi:NADP-dependent 3-hydroxy acid dehydrogenase YdfG
MIALSPSDKQRRVVLITGASSGIGKACAEHLASRGFRVFGAQRHVVGDDTRASGVEHLAMDVDVDDDASVNRAIQNLLEKAGRLDAIVNNAGFALMGSVEDTSIVEAKAQMETNFFGVLRVCLAVLPIMREQGRGHIVNISSLGRRVGAAL